MAERIDRYELIKIDGLEGVDIQWWYTPLQYTVVTDDQVIIDEVDNLFYQWTKHVWLSAENLGQIPSENICADIGAKCRDGINSIQFVEDWPLSDGLAETVWHIDQQTGRIWEADVYINMDNRIGDPDETTYDLESILSHEIGHFLGLSHSYHPRATMWPALEHGQIFMRDLNEDDIEGIKAIYDNDDDMLWLCSTANLQASPSFLLLAVFLCLIVKLRFGLHGKR